MTRIVALALALVAALVAGCMSPGAVPPPSAVQDDTVVDYPPVMAGADDPVPDRDAAIVAVDADGDYRYIDGEGRLDSIVVTASAGDDHGWTMTGDEAEDDVAPRLPFEALGWLVGAHHRASTPAVPVIRPGEHFVLRVRLAMPPSETAAVHSPLSTEMRRNLLALCAGDRAPLVLTPVVVADEARFEKSTDVPAPFPVDVARLCSEDGRPVADEEDHGYATFDVKLHARRARGLATVAISLWVGTEPLDEIVMRVCIDDRDSDSAACRSHELATAGSPGALLVDGAQLDGARAIAGVHVLTLPEGLTGVMRLAGEHRAWHWPLDGSDAALRRQLERWQDYFGVAGDEGREIRNVLFNVAHERGLDAEAAFDAAVARYWPADDPLKTGGLRPRIWVRYLPARGDTRMLIYPLPQLSTTRPGRPELGRGFSVVSSLPPRHLTSASECIDHWIPVIPAYPEDPALHTAQIASERIAPRVSGDGRLLELWPGRQLPLPDSLPQAIEPLTNDIVHPASALVLLGHNGDGTFDFIPAAASADRTTLSAADVRARFGAPSLGIFLVCNSAEVGYNGIADRLHTAGLTTMLLTTKPVDAGAAGAMLGCFLKAVETAPGPEITVGDAYQKAETCMFERGMRQELFGFALAGDSDLLLCTPRHPRGHTP